jgi:hypothetical protein
VASTIPSNKGLRAVRLDFTGSFFTSDGATGSGVLVISASRDGARRPVVLILAGTGGDFRFLDQSPVKTAFFDPAGTKPYTFNKTNATVNQRKKLNKIFRFKIKKLARNGSFVVFW